MPVKFCTDLRKSLFSSSLSTDMKIFDTKKSFKIQGNYIAMLLCYTELQIPIIKNGYHLYSHNTYSVCHPVLPNLLRPLATLGQHICLQSWSKTTTRAFLLWEGAWRQRMLRAEERWKEAEMPSPSPAPQGKDLEAPIQVVIPYPHSRHFILNTGSRKLPFQCKLYLSVTGKRVPFILPKTVTLQP